MSVGRRSLAAIDPAVMQRVIGRPEDRAARDADDPGAGSRPTGHYSRARAEGRTPPPIPSPRRET